MTKSTLESLPIELRLQILLEVADLHSLRSLALSSPSFHQAYRLARLKILSKILLNQYDGLVDISEAIASVRSRKLHASRSSDRDKIFALLDDRRRSGGISRLRLQYRVSRPLPDQPSSIDEVLDLLELHKIAIWFLDDYSKNAPRPHWIGPATWSSGILPLKFSDIEKKRFFRAFYRLQTNGNLFSSGENAIGDEDDKYISHWDPIFGVEEMWQLFVGTLPPWEVEELGCLWKYIHDRHSERYFEIANDLMQYGVQPVSVLPEHLRLPKKSLILDCDDLAVDDIDRRETIACLGPMFLYKFLREEDYITRRNLLCINATVTFLCFPLCSPRSSSDYLPLLYPADRFDLGLDVPGFLELISALPEIERPNAAWKKFWIDFMQEDEPLFEEMFTTGNNGPLWAWGYAIWDSDRLADWGAPSNWSQVDR
ncbi:hypothetical protein BJX70DRAFT_283286 [Aspergillus crustosus]